MKYVAKVNTAGPRTGFISVGEILTDAQAEALGEDKLRDLVKRGVLGTMADQPSEEKHAPENADMETGEPEPAQPETADEESAEAADEEELPELSLTDDLVSDGPEEESDNGAKKGGRRKTK